MGNRSIVDFSVENSDAKSDLRKSLTTINTVAKLSRKKPVQILAKLDQGVVRQEYVKGLPFLCDIPILGYFFRITKERKMRKQLVFVLQLKERSNYSIPGHYKFFGLVDLSNNWRMFRERQVERLGQALAAKPSTAAKKIFKPVKAK